MAWYYFSGKVVRSIPVSRTKSVAVIPNTKVEILEVTQEVQAMISAGVLRRTGKQVGMKSMEDQPPKIAPKLRDVMQPSALAQHFADKGVTSSKNMPPKKTGTPEYTIHEIAAQKVDESASKVKDPVTSTNTVADPVSVSTDENSTSEGFGKSWKRKKRYDQ